MAWAIAPTAAEQAGLSVDDQGVGPLGASVPFDAAAIAAVLPGFVIESSEVEGARHFVASRRGAPALEIYKGAKNTVGQILVTGPGIPTASGAAVARAARQVYAGGRLPNCVAGTGIWAGKVFCISPRQKYVVLIFSGHWDGPPGLLPAPEVLEDWTVEAILWRQP